MKAIIKRWLFAGFALSLAALTARRVERDLEIAGSLDIPQQDKSSLPAAQGGKGQAEALPSVSGGSGHTGPLPGMPAGNSTGPLPHSPTVSVTFSGKVVRKGSRLALREVAGVLYPLEATPNTWSFEGADVRVTGKINLSTRMLHVNAIEPAVL